MARTETDKGKIQGNSFPEIRAGLKQATLRLSPAFPRGPGKRPLEYGLILSRLAAWFLLQGEERQLEIVAEGGMLSEALANAEEWPAVFEGEAARAFVEHHLPELIAAATAGSVDAGPGPGDRGSEIAMIPVEGKITKSQPNRKRANSSN